MHISGQEMKLIYSPYEIAAMGAEGGLPEINAHKLVPVGLMDSPPDGPTPFLPSVSFLLLEYSFPDGLCNFIILMTKSQKAMATNHLHQS